METVLAARSDFSLGESSLSPSDIIKHAKIAGMKAAALTDTMTISGLTDLTKAALKEDIKPIIGVRLRLTDQPEWRPSKSQKKRDMPKAYFITLYARTETGLKSIYRLLSKANAEPYFYYVSKIGFDNLYEELENNTEHLALVYDTMNSALECENFLDIAAKVHATGLKAIYAPFVAVATPYYARITERAMQVVDAGYAEPLAIRPALYAKGDADVKDVLLGVMNNQRAAHGTFRIPHSRDMHITESTEFSRNLVNVVKLMVASGRASVRSHLKQAIANTDTFPDLFEYVWAKQEPSLPKLAPNEDAKVAELCKAGWAKRFGKEVFGHKPTSEELKTLYLPRLKYELGVLSRLKFSGYFLLVEDITTYARESGIWVGPGRGSVGGSLVAYLMGITDCDPIRFGLLFERFINPERIDLPDADLDFMASRRHEIFEYLYGKYGIENVAGVSNFGELGGASALRSIGKLFDMSESEYAVSKLIPKKHGSPVSLDEAYEEVSEIKSFAEKNEHVWKFAKSVEGKMRSYGQHAAGVVVGGEPLVNRAVLETRTNGQVVNWDKRIVEDQGLVKMDILGLITLDTISMALDYVRERMPSVPNLFEIPLDDEAVMMKFSMAQTNAIFQFEGSGAKKMLQDMYASTNTPLTFNDIVAVTALNRPGPLEAGLDKLYIRGRADPSSVNYLSPHMRSVLEETFGAIVYQEQVMQIARSLSGFTGPEADVLRKAIGKKDADLMSQQRKKFVDGAVAGYANVKFKDGSEKLIHRATLFSVTGSDEKLTIENIASSGKTLADGSSVDTVAIMRDGIAEANAEALWNDIEGFAAYSFNKSHAVEYTLISYQSMYLKTYHTTEFFAAALSTLSEEKLIGIVRDAKRHDIDVIVPDINQSTNRFEILNDRKLLMPFSRIKGISDKTGSAIVEARAAGAFKSIDDVADRVAGRNCNIRHRGFLEKVGAFSSIDATLRPANDPTRLLDQHELLPGLIIKSVPVNRSMLHDKATHEIVGSVVDNYRAAHGATSGAADGLPVMPIFGKKAQFMIIMDAPHADEEKAGVMGVSNSAEAMWDAIKINGLTKNDIYWTALLKRPKMGKMIDSKEVAMYSPYLEQEIQYTETPVVLACGTNAVRYFLPDLKGRVSEFAGEVYYNKERDLNVIVGFNPGEIYFDPDKLDLLAEAVAVAIDHT